jgi:tetratricopeptide (TPR) repeat protein
MQHVKQIRELIDRGEAKQAEDALEQLLSLGPKNTEALKLRAAIYERQGRFNDEAKVWEQVIKVDREDQDAVDWALRRQLEDREHFYFTDDIPGGGRKFLAYPRSLITLSAAGLVGCMVFLVVSQFAGQWAVLSHPAVILGVFGLCVLAPWAAIVINWFRMMKHVVIQPRFIEIATRFKTIQLPWEQLDQVCLAHSFADRGTGLALVIVPRDATIPAIEINLDENKTSIRARSYLVREISRASQRLAYATRSELNLAGRRVLHF